MQNSECRIRSGAILNSEFCILHSDLHERELAVARIDTHRFSRLIPRRKNRELNAADLHHRLLVKVPEHDIREAVGAALAAVTLELLHRQARLVLKVRLGELALDAVDEIARG